VAGEGGGGSGGFGRGLADVQAALYALITAPEGVEAGLGAAGRTARDLEAIVRPNERMTAVERLDVYANMYFYRILDVLRDEYARLAAAVGEAAFHNLVTDYLLACRPAHPSLREAGARLPAFVAAHALGRERPWLAELARLERTHLDLFDGEDAEPLTLEAVRALPPESLPALELRAIPCHAVLVNEHAIAEAWESLGASAGAEDIDVPAAVETLLVWRRDVTVFHRPLPADEAPLVALLAAGARFDTICERLLATTSEPQAVPRAFELLARWLADGVIGK